MNLTRRAIIASAVAAGLAACAPRFHSAALRARLPRFEENAFVTGDGRALALRRWGRFESAETIILAVHGFNDYSRAFEAAGAFWARRGIATLAYDQQGFGASGPVGIWPAGLGLERDLREAVAAIRRARPEARVILLGASMGGAVVMSAMTQPGAPKLDGLALVAPAVWGWSSMPGLYRGLLRLTYSLTPGAWVTGEGLNVWPSDNIPMLRAFSADPLVIKKTRTDALKGLVDLMERAHRAAPHIPGPVLFLVGDKDEIVPREPLDQVAAQIRAEKRILTYPEGYHMLLRDLQAENVWRDIADFAEGRA